MLVVYFQQLEGVDVRFSEEAKEEKVKEDCCPGKPFITFRTEVILLVWQSWWLSV